MRRAQSFGSAAAEAVDEDAPPESDARRLDDVAILDEVGVIESAEVGVDDDEETLCWLLLVLDDEGTRVVPKMFSSIFEGCFQDDTLCSVS